MYTNQGASYSQFYQPRRRRAYERREEVVEENQSQVSDSQSIHTIPFKQHITVLCCSLLVKMIQIVNMLQRITVKFLTQLQLTSDHFPGM